MTPVCGEAVATRLLATDYRANDAGQLESQLRGGLLIA